MLEFSYLGSKITFNDFFECAYAFEIPDMLYQWVSKINVYIISRQKSFLIIATA